MIRKAVMDDYELLKPEFEKVHQMTPFKDIPMDEDHMLRMFAMATSMPNFFCMVAVDTEDQPTGLVAGFVDTNVFGVRVATDMLVAGGRGIPTLINEFLAWSVMSGAEMFSLTEISQNPRYVKLIKLSGLKLAGGIYFKEI